MTIVSKKRVHLNYEGHKILDAASAVVTGSVQTSGSLDVVGSSRHHGGLSVTGNATATGNFAASGNVTGVTGSFSNVAATGTVDVGGSVFAQTGSFTSVTATGNINGADFIGGIANFTTVQSTNSSTSGTATIGTLSVTGNSAVVGTETAGTLAVTNHATVGGNLTVTGDLTVNGSTVTVNVTTVRAEDKNIELAYGAGGTDIIADGGGITLIGDTNHTINWSDANDAWTFSENLFPDSSDTKNLGSQAVKWKHGNFSGIVSASTVAAETLHVSQSAVMGGTLVVAGATTFNGSAIFNQGFIVSGSLEIAPGNDLTVNGIKLTPIKATGTSGDTVDIMLFDGGNLAIADNQIVKGEIEVVAMSANKLHGASIKLSMAGMRSGSSLSGAATVVSRESFGASGALFDVVVTTDVDGAFMAISGSQGAYSTDAVRWYAQFVKKMVLNSDGTIGY